MRVVQEDTLQDYTEQELDIFLEEIVFLLNEGYKVPQIAERLRWSESDVFDLLRTNLGRAQLELSEKAAGQFDLEEGDLTLAEARGFAKKRLPHYIKKLDSLIDKAQSEQVRLNAATALLKITGALEEHRDEVVEMPEYLVKNLAEAIAEAQERRGTTAVSAGGM